MWLEEIAVLLIGSVVGVMPGLFGVAGGFIMVPALNFIAGVPLPIAIGTTQAQTLGPVTTGLLHRRRGPWQSVQLPLTMLGGAVMGLELGLKFLEWARESGANWVINGRAIPRIDVLLPAIYAALLFALAALVAWEWHISQGRPIGSRRGWLEGVRLPPYAALDEIEGRRISLWVVATLGMVVGFLNGGFGMGGAMVNVPALVFLVGVPTQRAISATLLLSWLNGLWGTFEHARLGNVNLLLLCLLLFGGAAGAQLGSVLGERWSGRKLRGSFSLILLSAATLIAARLAWRIWA